MQKKIEIERLIKLVKIFKEIHLNSSTRTRYGNWYEIEPFNVDKEFDEEVNEIFMMEIKPLLLSLEKKYKEKLNTKAFLSNTGGSHENNSIYLKKYLDIIKKSTSYSKYINQLVKESFIYYTYERLNLFSSEELFNDYAALELTIEVKDVKLVKNYQYSQEKERFDKIEYHWKIRECDEVFERVYDIFPNFCQDYLEIEELKKERDIPETLKLIFNKLKTTVDKYNITNLGERIEKIISELNETGNDFFKIRSKFGKDQGITKENKSFEDSSELSKKVCSRIVIDLLKSYS